MDGGDDYDKFDIFRSVSYHLFVYCSFQILATMLISMILGQVTGTLICE